MVLSVSHMIITVMAVSTICSAFQQAVMAIDLSRLYGHLSNKRSAHYKRPPTRRIGSKHAERNNLIVL